MLQATSVVHCTTTLTVVSEYLAAPYFYPPSSSCRHPHILLPSRLHHTPMIDTLWRGSRGKLTSPLVSPLDFLCLFSGRLCLGKEVGWGGAGTRGVLEVWLGR